MRAGALCKDRTSNTLEDLDKMLSSAIEGIQKRGGAQLGDKTLLDALIPVHEKLKEHAAGANPDNAAALKDAADAAEQAIDATRSFIAHRGRASQVGERSANTPDPGIVAIAKILQDWCTEFGVARTATVAEVIAAA
jgi:dihydroxyacetone kinase